MTICQWKRRTLIVMAIMVIMPFGCSGRPKGEQRLKTYPVEGIVHVDGDPRGNVLVTFHGVGEETKMKRRLVAETDENGKFVASTYDRGDGLPEGTYKLTFRIDVDMPGVADPRKRNAATVDLFKNAYANPEKSEHQVTVKGAKVKLDVIELSSKVSTGN
jgi:hypothetical protein